MYNHRTAYGFPPVGSPAQHQALKQGDSEKFIKDSSQRSKEAK